MSERWKPKQGEDYYFVDSAFNVDSESYEEGYVWDEERIESGNCFERKEDAKVAAEKVKALLLSLHDNDTAVSLNIPDTVPKLEVDDRGVVLDLKPLPKLTADVFNRPDCPEWAKWVAVNQNGIASYYDEKPARCRSYFRISNGKRWVLSGSFDASDWRNSLIERPAKLPKLTTEVFDRPDCPKWAKYAAVDKDGSAVFFESTPRVSKWGEWWKRDGVEYYEFGNNYDASDWKHSLIERPVKETKLPDWCKVGAWGYYIPITEYCKIEQIGTSFMLRFTDGDSTAIPLKDVCNLAQARLRPYNADEMKALVGKVIKVSNGSAGICTSYSAAWNEIKFDDDYWAPEEFMGDRFSIDGKPAGVLEHLENGEWVK